MSGRLPRGGRLIDRTTRLRFRFDGAAYHGYAGDTLASALLGAGRTLLGRSFKYHRPRGLVAHGAEEPNALVQVGRDGAAEPNARAPMVPLAQGLEATSQNRWPSLERDAGALNARLSRFLSAGFYYKTFTWPRSFWKHVYEPLIRRAAGLGRAGDAPDEAAYEHFHVHVDLLVVGGGIAGLRAAEIAGSAGAEVLLLEQSGHWGGRAPVDGATIDGLEAGAWVERQRDRLDAMATVKTRLNVCVTSLHDHGYVLAEEAPRHGPRRRLWRIRARRIVTATGAIERPIAFAANDLPGVMLASTIRDLAVNYGVAAGDRTVLVTACDDGYRTALALHRAGLAVPAILDARAAADGALPAAAREAGLRVLTGKGIATVAGRMGVERVAICDQSGSGAVLEEIACDAVAMAGGWSPAVHLWSQAGGKLIWDEARAQFRPDSERPPRDADGAQHIWTAGCASGALTAAEAMSDAEAAARDALTSIGKAPSSDTVTAAAPQETPPEAVWIMPDGAPAALRAKMWLDFQNDVKVTDVELAAQEGFVSVEHAKRYTTLGMATDQGKLSNVNGLAVLARALDVPIPEVGTTTFRPPFVPVTMGSIAGSARGDLFQPIRRTPMHDWHAANGARWEPVGQWRRPLAYPRDGEDVAAAAQREARAVREAVGLLDASTLGKIVVAGPDAGRFLDMIYTGRISTLKPGRCRYGLMCNENGFVTDDGVVARLDADRFLCHTTSGGAAAVHGAMEDWLQTEWTDWQVLTADVTEHYAQIAVVGPKARDVLAGLTDADISRDALPFMAWTDATVADVPARIFRISFSGELSYEIAIPAGQGVYVWDALMGAGAAHGIAPYGTEALHILRAEKGYIIVGDETDGTVTPHDVGMGWAVSSKKDDFVGKRGLERPFLKARDRWRLVGLETPDGSVLPDGAYATAPGRNANGQKRVQGRVTSTYPSPTLGRGIALGLVERGPDRIGEELSFPTTDGRIVKARIRDAVFYDPEGERQNA